MTPAPSSDPSPPPPRRPRGRPRRHPPPAEPRRRRGAQPGNRNRLRHGRFTAETHAAKAVIAQEIAAVEFRLDEALAWHACELAATTATARQREPKHRSQPSTIGDCILDVPALKV